MKGAWGDFFRTWWALIYWNARKSVYVLRGRKGQCPCHNPSDSGEPLLTGCDAIATWRDPARFRRVCPLLQRSSSGQWVCSVAPAQVKPFWGRAVGYFALAALIIYLVAGLAVFGVMRGVGFKVSVQTVWWPPAWGKVREAQADYFVEQAKGHYAEGRIAEMLRTLAVAQSITPHDYEVGLLQARFNQIGNPVFADATYARLMREHPQRSNETAEMWFRSLLSRNRLAEVAELARSQIKADPSRAAVWAHALVFAAQQRQRPDWLEQVASDEAVSVPVRAALALAAKVERAPTAEERRALVLGTPVRIDFLYDQVYRIEQLIEDGFTDEARAALASARSRLPGRDVARLMLAAYARAGNSAQVAREFAGLLSEGRTVTVAELEVLAIHLVRFPDARLIRDVVAASERLTGAPVDAQAQLYYALMMAAGMQKDPEAMALAQQKLHVLVGRDLPVAVRLREVFFGTGSSAVHRSIVGLLPQITPLSLELNYALLASGERLR